MRPIGGQVDKVRTGARQQAMVAACGNGQIAVGQDVQLPENAYIEIDYDAEKLENKNGVEKVLRGISLVDETGAEYRIELTIALESNDYAKYTLTFPGGQVDRILRFMARPTQTR